MTPPIDKACLEPAFAGLSRIKPECIKKLDPKLSEAILKPRVRDDGLSPLGKTVLADVKKDVESSAPADLTSVASAREPQTHIKKPVEDKKTVATDVPVVKPHKSTKPKTPPKAKVRVYDETNIPAPKREPKAAPVAEAVEPKAPEATKAPVAETSAEAAPKPAPAADEKPKFEISTGPSQDVQPAKTTSAKAEPELADPFAHGLTPKHEVSAATTEPKSAPAVRPGLESLSHAEPTNRGKAPVSTSTVETTAETVDEVPTPAVENATTTPVAETPAEIVPTPAPSADEKPKFEISTGPSQDVQPAKTTLAKAEPELADPFAHDLTPKHEVSAATTEPKSAPAVRPGLESLAHAEPTNRSKAPASTPAVETSAETVAEVPTPAVENATTTPVDETPAKAVPTPASVVEPEKPKFEISTGPSQDVQPAKTTPEKVEDYKGPFASDLITKYEAPAADSKSLPSKVTLPAPFTKLARGEAAHLGGDPAKIAANNADAAGKAIDAGSAKAQAEAQANIQGYKPNDAISGGAAQNSAAQSADKTPAPYTGPVYTSPATVTPDATPAAKPPLDKTFMEGSMLNQTGKADEAPSLLDGVVQDSGKPSVPSGQMQKGTTDAHDSSGDTVARDARIAADAKAAAEAKAKAAKPAEPPTVAPSAPEVPPASTPSSDSVPVVPAEGAAPEAQASTAPTAPAVKPEPEVDPKEAEAKAKYQAELDAAEKRNRLQRKADDERIAAARKETERLRTEAQQKADSLAAAKAATPAPVEAPSAPLPKPVDPFEGDPNYLKRRGVRYAKMDIESDKNIYYNLDEPGKLTRIRDFGLFTWASDYMPKELETYEPSMKKADIKYNGGKN